MHPHHYRFVLPGLILVLLLPSWPRHAAARPAADGGRAAASLPAPISPIAGARVDEGAVRFEVARPSGAQDVRIVIARFPFEPTAWTSVPSGPSWTVVPCGDEPIALAPLNLVDPTDTRLWWAVVWTDPRTGALRASEARDLTVVPRFANRVAPDGTLHPSAAGRLSASAAGARRPIELAAGYTLVPGAPAPTLPVRLMRAARPVPIDPGVHRAYLVQFADDSPDAARARVANAGGEIVWPISGAAYLVRMTSDAVERLRQAEGDPWIADYEPAYKLSTALDPAASGAADITALLIPGADGDAAVAALRALGASNVESHRNEANHLLRFELDRSRLADAAAVEDIVWIEPTPVYTFDNDKAQWVVQSGIQNSRPVTDRGIRGQGQVVMTSDSGIRANHEMFNDSTLAINSWGQYPSHRKIIAYLPGSDSPLITFGDDASFDYHGTHTAGTVAGNPDPTSSAPWSGMAKDARLFFMDLAGNADNGLRPPLDLNDLYQPSYTGNAGGAARISSNSWGGGSGPGAYTLNCMQVDQFAWNHPDYLFAFSSGNVGVFASVRSPATAKNCLTVGATGNGTKQNTLASFSSRGPTADGRRKPTVMAPGDLVTSSFGSTRYAYATLSGTSMSTPAVAGAMALVRQYLKDGWYPTGAPVGTNRLDPSAALLRAMAVNAGRNDVTSFRVPDNTIGYGRIAIDDVLFFPGDSTRTLLIDTRDGLADQQFVEYQVQVTDTTRALKIALCWTDAPGNPASQVQLVNDLDLLVTHGGSTYRGNYLLNYASAAGGTRDSLNVEEIVRLPSPGPGLWTVRVEGRRVLQGPEPFALCITGGVGGPAGAIALDRFQYGLSDTVAIEVIDTNASGPIVAQVMSNTEPWPQSVTLTGTNGVFRGAIPIGPTLPQTGDGVIAVTSGDLLTVTYASVSPATQVVTTARINVQAPTITNVHATALAGTQAVISWTTDVAGSSRVRFGTAAPVSVVDSAGFTKQHTVLLTGLQPATTYRYDVQSATPAGDVSADSLDGQHRSFTTRPRGSIALLMDDPSGSVLATWNNAAAALGWDLDVLPAAGNDPPLVGDSAAGLRSYSAVLWQVDPNRYPPFSDAQRAAIDSLVNSGGRLLVTGHDIGFGLSDAGSPSYSPEREAWLESGLKSRYYYDNIYADTLAGVPGSPVSGAYTDSIPYAYWLYPDSGDNFGAAPGTDGVWAGDWTENFFKSKYMGMHWESNAPRGTPGLGVWGGQKSRLVGMFYEWRALGGSTTTHLSKRTGVLQDAVSWLLGHRPPEVHIVSPAPGTVVTGDYLSIRYSVRPDSGRAITHHWLDFSLDGGETWAPANTAVCADSGCIWDLTGSLGGPPTPNSTGVMLRARVADNGSPALYSTAVMTGPFTLARAGGDTRGPVLVAGSAMCSPTPLRWHRPAMLSATFSDAAVGGGAVTAAEYSIGATPAPAGSGTPMSGAFGNPSVPVSAALATDNVLSNGTRTFWLRGRDAAGNWGVATAITVPISGSTTVGVDDVEAVDFLGSPSPNPFREASTIRFGLARAGEVRLELFDVTGRRVQTLASGIHAPGPHVVTWNGRDQNGHAVGNGVYFLRLTLPSRVFNARIAALR